MHHVCEGERVVWDSAMASIVGRVRAIEGKQAVLEVQGVLWVVPVRQLKAAPTPADVRL